MARIPELNFFGVNARNLYPTGGKRDGFIPMTREGGSNGTVGTIWVEGAPMTIGRLKGGMREWVP